VFEANWYVKFLHSSVREKTYYLSSRDGYGEFRALFRMPLEKIDDLVSLCVENNWIHQTKHCRSNEEMVLRLELHILGILKVLGHNAPFRTLKTDTNISDKEHRLFFNAFIDNMYKVRKDFIGYPSSQEELGRVTD